MEGTARSRGRVLLTLAAALHLGCIAIGAMHRSLNGSGYLGSAAAYYSALSGAYSGYGFFAPGVGAMPWATFEITDANGAVITDALESGANHEADLRIRNILPLFNSGDEALRRSLVASWAGKMFARHPSAESVAVRLEAYDLPSMQEFRDGKQPAWEPLYKAKFVTRSRHRAALQEKGGSP